MSFQRSMSETIDEIRGIVPETEVDFLVALDILEQGARKPTRNNEIYRWETLKDICNFFVEENVNRTWAPRILSLIYQRPILVKDIK